MRFAAVAGVVVLWASPARGADAEVVHRLVPCTPGLTIEYEMRSKSDSAVVRITDTVRGAGARPALCVVDRVTVRGKDKIEKDAYVRELLEDRVLNAGWIDRQLAFAPPIIKAPIATGTKWRFDTVEYEIKAHDETIELPGGKWDHCVRIQERARDGSYEAESVYAPGVGLVLYESRDVKQRAIKVTSRATDAPSRTGGTKRESPKTSKR